MTQLPPHRHTHRLIESITRIARRQGTVILGINTFMGVLLADNAALEAKIKELDAAVAADQASDQAIVDQLDQVIADLKASGDTQAAIDALSEIQNKITTVSSPNAPPTTPPPGGTGGTTPPAANQLPGQGSPDLR